jgi:hypothetical protein
MTKAEKTMLELEKQGFVFDHVAMHKGYYFAGHTSAMQPDKNYEYIRIYDGVSKNIKRGGYWIRIQRTFIMKKAIEKGV